MSKVFVPAEFDIYEVYKTIDELLKLMSLTFYLHHQCHAGNVVLDRTYAAFSAHNNMEEGASCRWVTKHQIWSRAPLLLFFFILIHLQMSMRSESLACHTYMILMSYATTAEGCNERTALLKMETKTHPAETLPHGWRGWSVLSGKEKGG